MKSIASIFTVLMLIIVVFYGMQVVGEEAVDNTNIDQESLDLIGNFSDNLNNEFDYASDFGEFDSNLSTNATFDNQDVYAQEFLEGKSSGQKKQGIVAKAVKIPDMIILSLGVPNAAVIWVKGIVALIISVLLGFAAFRVFFGGGKVSDN